MFVEKAQDIRQTINIPASLLFDFVVRAESEAEKLKAGMVRNNGTVKVWG